MVLYRKYRPQTFGEVQGQEHIVRTLKNQIKSRRLSHAYLFSGSRGTGKTTIAKIFARAVNCENPVNGNACGVCDTCQKIEQGNAMNVIEIDAASHNGVDNIREINEEVKYTPTVGRYKVYIIDEVHMLSIGAFNALLKTLEEPPEHIIFILATTDPQKIPVTIVSRCQRYEFKRLSIKEIKETMQAYMEKEQIAIEDDALDYIAQLAEGGMRDALSLLEQSISFYEDETITTEKVQDLIGTVDRKILYDVLEAIIKQNAEQVLILSDRIYREGRNIRQFVIDLMKHCRNVLMLKISETSCAEQSCYTEKLKEQAQMITVADLMYLIKQLGNLENELRTALPSKILLEVGLLKLCEGQADDSLEGMQIKMRAMEQKIEQLMKMPVAPIASPAPQKKIIPARMPKAVPEEIKSLLPRWQEILQSVEEPMARIYCQSMQLGYIEGDKLYIIYTAGMEGIKEEKYFNPVKEAIYKIAQREVNLESIQVEEYVKKVHNTYGTHPDKSPEVDDISATLRLIKSKVNFEIEVTS